jgi:hypothetical protein
LGAASGCTTDGGEDGLAVSGCEPMGAARPICGFQNPEDLVALPGGEAILVSEYGAMEGDRPGDLALFVLETEERRVIFRGGDADGSESSWGDPSCPGPPPPAFSPHGIHLSTRTNGAQQLLVVQHGGRESIEFFEVRGSGQDFEVSWRGCVVAPHDTWLNSVAALPGGGFVTTNMMPRSAAGEDLAEAFVRGDLKGYVLEWQSESGFQILEGTTGPMPNGIEVSADGHKIFLNSSGDGEVRRIDRASGTIEARAAVPGLDNARWAPDGRLLVASVLAAADGFQGCMELAQGQNCPMPFQIVAVHPESMETEVLYRNEGAPMGGGTVGLQIGQELFIGSFAGDRILRVALD